MQDCKGAGRTSTNKRIREQNDNEAVGVTRGLHIYTYEYYYTRVSDRDVCINMT